MWLLADKVLLSLVAGKLWMKIFIAFFYSPIQMYGLTKLHSRMIRILSEKLIFYSASQGCQ